MGKNRKNTPKVQESEEDEFISDDDEEMLSMDEEEEQQIEEEARIARDETDSEEEADNAEFLAHGVDLDLPDEDSADEEQDDEASQDSELDDYYRELGIAGEKDYSKKDGEDKLYKTTKKKEVKKPDEEKKAGDKTKIIETIIKRTRDEPSYKTVSRIIKIVKQVFNTPAKNDQEALKESAKNVAQL